MGGEGGGVAGNGPPADRTLKTSSLLHPVSPVSHPIKPNTVRYLLNPKPPCTHTHTHVHDAEAGFSTQTLGLQVLTFMRPNTLSVISNQPNGKLAVPLGPFVGEEEDVEPVTLIPML